MRSLLRNKRKLYLCQLYKDGNIKKYHEPIELYDNYQVTNSDSDLAILGLESYNYLKIKTDLSKVDLYHIGDRAYVNVKPPEEHDVLCKTADYEVYKEPVVMLNQIEVVLKKLSGRNG